MQVFLFPYYTLLAWNATSRNLGVSWKPGRNCGPQPCMEDSVKSNADLKVNEHKLYLNEHFDLCEWIP